MSDICEKERASKDKAVTELAKALSNTVIKTKLNGAFPELAGLINSATGPQPSQRNRLPKLMLELLVAALVTLLKLISKAL